MKPFHSLSLPVIIAIFCLCGLAGNRPRPAFPVLNDSLSVRDACFLVSRYCMRVSGDNDTSACYAFYRTVDSTTEILSRTLGGRNTNPSASDSIMRIVYYTWNIRFDQRDTLLETLLPHLVYKNRKGACLGVSLILLMLAEKTGCPLYGVMLPGHFFCRFDNGTDRFNIEPNKNGFRHPDSYYRNRYPVAGRPGYDLGNLPGRQTIGMFCYNAGAWCMGHGHVPDAIRFFQEAGRRIPGFIEAQGNRALAYADAGDLDSALAIFDVLFAAHPDFVNLAANYGSVAMTAKQYDRAKEIFRKGLDYYPEDTTLLYGLAQIYEKMKTP
jgi:hypothetical protein